MSFSEWKEVGLRDLLNFRRGHDLPKTNMIEGSISVVGSNGVIGFHNAFTTKAPCLTIDRSGNIGNPCYINKNCWAHNTTLYVDDYKNNDPKYLYYLLKTLDLGYYGGGSAVPTLNRNHIHPIMVKATQKVSEQKSIAYTLSSLDDKIELNNRINKTLEEMAQAIFKSWFVDFDPFQDGEFEDSELGRIPKGWRIFKLKDISSFQNGYAFYKVGYSDSGVMVIDLGNVDLLGNFTKTKADKFIPIELFNQEKMKKFYVLRNDLVIIMTDRKSTMDLLGKTAKISNDEQYILNQRVGRIRVNENINVNFLYTYLNSALFLNELKKNALGSVQKYVNTNHITDLKLIVPDNITMSRFGKMINPIFEQMELHNQENQTLITIRDTLLPKLMSGEIRVPIEEV